MAPTYVGIDISKARLDVHLLPDEEAFSVDRADSWRKLALPIWDYSKLNGPFVHEPLIVASEA
ncbi:hypothetical protein [Polymorphobacter megasporae]|uniref:hypothetical protein n=1 Tax=Glacieibacterium megasporae TaxID=2835787 RepID=UPI001C1E884E|nr:hypothetical protein [Polymorphobacter megasporae]UAJ10975.1 hypothetical protein KTC28_04470 [Polymorphobacter megasporae]